jgi:sugar transferase EpsL
VSAAGGFDFTRHLIMYVRFFKRWCDVVVSIGALLALLPLFVLLVITIRVVLGAPVFFVQERPGRHAKPFRLIKFRTMDDRRDGDGTPLPDDQRLGAFGRFLRATSFDELPEFWNVLRGEMSVVGPRPLLMQYLSRYSAREARRHEVRPGLTGLAQVSGRNALAWEQRLELDVKYVEQISAALDLKIMLLTVVQVLRRQGISQPGRSTVDEFRGSPGA